MKVGDLVQSRNKGDVMGNYDDDAVGERTGVITGLRRNSMNSSDKYTTYYVYWSYVGHTTASDHSDLKVINASR